MKGFGSDNQAGIHPRILNAIVRANTDHAPSYGMDELSLSASEMMKKLFGPSSETYFVFNGTAANVIALGQLVRPHHAVLTSNFSHLLNDECNAPGRLLGCQIIGVPTTDGKLSPEQLKPYLIRRGDQHASQVRAISITQPTEVGTVYSLDELRNLSAFAKAEKLALHMDGARLVNAAATLGCSLFDITTGVGIDALSLGGTKNGLLFGEAVVFLKPDLGADCKFSRKQLMQLPSKTRFLAAQFLEFLGTDLWRENALHANAMAERLALGLRGVSIAKITQPRQANAVFVCFPKAAISILRESGFFYVWNELTFECRLMTSWDTKPEEIDAFVATAHRIQNTTDGGR